MKSTNKNLRFRKIKVAKVNTFTIIGGTNSANTVYPHCAPAPSNRPPRDGKTQQTSADGNCETET